MWTALALLPALLSVAQNAEDRPCRTDYVIRARYEEAERRLHGELVVRWKNESRDVVPDLWFHAYWNAFANSESVHMREARGALRGRGVDDDDWGWQRVTRLFVGDADLTGDIEWVAPDDRSGTDRTVFRAVLPRAARPGETVEARLSWEARVPRVRRRTGWKDDFLFMGQWFPKLGVYESKNGWNCHTFHASTEFFSDYGTYDVELDLPASYADKVGASGVQAGPTSGGVGRVIVSFKAPSEADRARVDERGRSPVVHDFAWTADRHFVKYVNTFHFDEWAAKYPEEIARVSRALERPGEELRVRDVVVTVLLQPEHANQGRRHFDAACTALFFNGLWWGGYPYEHITVVDPPWGGGGAAGMEYPTLFTGGSRMFTKPAMLSPESVVVHECTHQFWQGLVGNNEFEAAWLDEGFTTWSQNEALALRYGMSMATTSFCGLPFDGVPISRKPGNSPLARLLDGDSIGLPRLAALRPLRGSGFLDWWLEQPLFAYGRQRDEPRERERTGYLAAPDSDPIDRLGWTYRDHRSYRANSYARTAVALRSLQGLVGDDRFLRGMRAYSETWRYRHPYPQDFFDAFQEGAKADIGWYFEQAFRSTASVDWRVDVSTESERKPRGFFPDEKGRWARATSDKPKDAEPPADGEAERERDENERADRERAEPGGQRTEVLVERTGELLLPLTLELAWDDGATERMIWSREEQARAAWWKPLADRPPSARKLVSARLDPDRRYSYDRDLSDNEWHADTSARDSLRWSERVFSQWLHLLHGHGGLGG